MLVHYMILAHEKPELLLEQIAALKEVDPTASISVFNGGRETGFFRDGPVPVCPRSRPLKYGNLTPFHLESMEWLLDSGTPFDYLVTLDSDVLPFKHGFPGYLQENRHVGYLGVRVQPAPDPTLWTHGPTVPEFYQSWLRRWKPLLPLDAPMWAFNPCHVFSRGTVEAIIKLPTLPAIKKQAYGSMIWALEEILIPSLVTVVGAATELMPGGDAIEWRSFTPREIEELSEIPDAFFLHRVTMQMDAPDRQAANAVRRSQPVPKEILDMPAVPHVDPRHSNLSPRWTADRWKHAFTRRYRPLHIRFRG